MIEDDGGKTSDSAASTRATTAEREIENAHLLSSPPREELKTHDLADALTAPDPSVEPLDRLTSPDVPPPQHPNRRVGGEDEHGAPAAASLPTASISLLPQQSEARSSVLEEEEWEIRKIIGKRRAGKGYEYKVRWKDTWLPRNELGNARRVLQEFEARQLAHWGSKPRRATRAGMGG